MCEAVRGTSVCRTVCAGVPSGISQTRYLVLHRVFTPWPISTLFPEIKVFLFPTPIISSTYLNDCHLMFKIKLAKAHSLTFSCVLLLLLYTTELCFILLQKAHAFPHPGSVSKTMICFFSLYEPLMLTLKYSFISTPPSPL